MESTWNCVLIFSCFFITNKKKNCYNLYYSSSFFFYKTFLLWRMHSLARFHTVAAQTYVTCGNTRNNKRFWQTATTSSAIVPEFAARGQACSVSEFVNHVIQKITEQGPSTWATWITTWREMLHCRQGCQTGNDQGACINHNNNVQISAASFFFFRWFSVSRINNWSWF